MNRRDFLASSSGLAAGAFLSDIAGPLQGLSPMNIPFTGSRFSHRLPHSDVHYKVTCGYVEEDPIADYTWAPDQAYEDFMDIKFGIRLHWGIYSILQRSRESWPFLEMSFEERQMYQHLYKTWYPVDFDANKWVDFFKESGARMFAFTSKHHDGFSMFDTKTRVTKRVNWVAPGGPQIEDCDHSYSIMETPFKRDVVKELCDAAHQKGMKVDLYFSHPDWYDADFRPYNYHPLQVPDSATLAVEDADRKPQITNPSDYFGKTPVVIKPNPDEATVNRMMARHRAQLEELLTRYDKIDMMCLDQFLGPAVWPKLRETLLHIRKIRPDVMLRARGIGNYGDYYTPEGFVPGSKENSDTPWFVIYPLGDTFSYDQKGENYKGSLWIVKSLIDAVAKGGNFMAAIGPDASGNFHPEAIKQLKETGAWLKINGEGIYATRPRSSELWKEGENIRFTTQKDGKAIFAFLFEWPGEQLIIKSVKPPKSSKIKMMGFDQPLQWRYDSAKGLVANLPSSLREKMTATNQLAYGFKIEM
ncbi:MAG: alpha-L-fucosidase [Chitinophagaceae bacterium]